LLVTAVPFFSERPGSCPKTYHPAGIERGTATIKIHETRDNLLRCVRGLSPTFAQIHAPCLTCDDVSRRISAAGMPKTGGQGGRGFKSRQPDRPSIMLLHRLSLATAQPAAAGAA
jgi:hypothetical protein